MRGSSGRDWMPICPADADLLGRIGQPGACLAERPGQYHAMTEEENCTPVSEVSRPDTEVPNALHPAASQPPDSIWERIRRHKVVEWTLAYMAFGYALLHGVQMLRETFEWPLLVSRLTVFSLVLGAPIAVTLAWYHGHRARHRVSGPELSILIALLVVAGSMLWWLSRNNHERANAAARMVVANTESSTPPAPASFNPPAHSIAVLPFINLSGDQEQEYFSDGLTEELLNSLTEINDLQVAARTSAFSFKGSDNDIGTIARKLNVGAVLEGSVRRSGHTIRITAQLINAVTGFHLWSKTYDRDLGDMLKLQTEIATAVAGALKVTLLSDVSARIELGGTRNPAALDAYLRASKAARLIHEVKDLSTAIGAYTEAIRLDPNYALAYAGRSVALVSYSAEATTPAVIRDGFQRAEGDARRAVALAPGLSQAHLALAVVLEVAILNFAAASEEYQRALSLAPGSAEALRLSGVLAVRMGSFDAGLTAVRRAVLLDPLGVGSYVELGRALYSARRFGEAVTTYAEILSLDPNYKQAYGYRGVNLYWLGDLQNARASCEAQREHWSSQWCLAVVYHKLGRHADAEAALAAMQSAAGAGAAYQYAEIYSQWGDYPKALDWLESAMRVRDSGLVILKTDPMLDSLRKEPRYQAIERALKFPN